MDIRGKAAFAVQATLVAAIGFQSNFVYSAVPPSDEFRARFGSGSLFGGRDENRRPSRDCFVVAKAVGPDGPVARARLIAWVEDESGIVTPAQAISFQRDGESCRAVAEGRNGACSDAFALGSTGPARVESREEPRGREWIRRCGGGRAYLDGTARALVARRLDDVFRRTPEIQEFDAFEAHARGPWTYGPKASAVRMECRGLSEVDELLGDILIA